MFDIKYPWADFKIWLPEMERWMRSNAAPHYIGNSAGAELTLHFDQEPNDLVKQRIQMYFDALNQAGESERQSLDQRRADAVIRAEQAILSIQWDQMIPAERKIIMRQELSISDLDALLTRYPQE